MLGWARESALRWPGIIGGRLIDPKLTGFLAAGFESQCPKHRRRAMLLTGEPKKRVCVGNDNCEATKCSIDLDASTPPATIVRDRLGGKLGTYVIITPADVAS
ncbi:hypothetical protein K443DRAFT_310763 [Laccaria amethystina LaAM-08-1]|uniref:Uncharacterized protein n=1 Tax=Laccaria amethystina LaAM-08-1 TaxID=1095629 RepID=A0A0C9WUQ3_9AGAR|nr:hypothetical protein K443DRAFT_310763 [Laccaria amethystina LaAM-08-1]